MVAFIRINRVSNEDVNTRLIFRRAEQRDTAAVQELYRSILEDLGASIDYPRWYSENHPAPAQIDGWIAEGNLYIVHGALGPEVMGAVVLDHEAPGGYSDAPWAVEATSEQALVVHVLGVSPNHQHQGVARFLLDNTIKLARDTSCLAVRLDVYEGNVPGHRLYAGYGFTDLGIHALHYDTTDLSEFRLYEYVVA